MYWINQVEWCLKCTRILYIPGRRCTGRADPEECLDLSICTGVLLGDTKGEAGGDCRAPDLGDIGWKEKWRLLVPGEGGMGQVEKELTGSVTKNWTLKYKHRLINNIYR